MCMVIITDNRENIEEKSSHGTIEIDVSFIFGLWLGVLIGLRPIYGMSDKKTPSSM